MTPCFNSNELYRTIGSDKYPFFGPCGDLCTFQISPVEKNRFSYLVLSKKDITFKELRDMIENSLSFHNQYEFHTRLKYTEKIVEIGKIIENYDIFGIFSDRGNRSEYYVCNGACKYKVIDTTGNLNIDEGDLVIFKDLKYDGMYPKKNTTRIPWIYKNYNEIAFKYHNESSYEVIPYFLEPED